MTLSLKNKRYFWFLNLFVIIAVLGISAKTVFVKNDFSKYQFRLSEMPHYIKQGFTLEDGLSDAIRIPAGSSVLAGSLESSGYTFLRPGVWSYKEYTITVKFDYTAQYDALTANENIIPAIFLPGLGDNFEIYLNSHLIVSEWHVKGGKITLHKLARGIAYSINPNFFNRGENTLTFRIYGDPTAVDTGLTVTRKYVIDNLDSLNLYDYSQTALAGIYLAVAVTFMVLFLLYKEKKLNLWFSITALSISMYAFFRVGAFQSVIKDYELALRLEIISLFSFIYFVTLLIYTCSKKKINLSMKAYTVIYAVFCAAVFIPGHQFVLDLIKVYVFLFVPFIIYVFISSLCVSFMRNIKSAMSEGSPLHLCIPKILSGTLCGNMIIGTFLPIVFAMIDLIVYLALSYQEVLLSQYGFLFFFSNVTFALASDIAEIQKRLITVSDELRQIVSKQESELVQISGEVEEAHTAKKRFYENVSKEIKTPLGEIIGAIELRILRLEGEIEATSWLSRLLENQRNLRKKLDGLLGDGEEYKETVYKGYDIESNGIHYKKPLSVSNHGGTRHLFVINPKSFVTLKDLKNFLLSIEMCFSAGHRAEYKIYISRYPRDAYSAVHRYLSAMESDETARVYAVGGDGILFDCLNGLAKFPNAELAPIPYGNANDFVRSFGADNIELFRDIKLMSKASPRFVDTILCGQQYALCSCSIGIEARAVQVFSKTVERINSGKARYFVPLIYKLGAVKSLLDGSQNNNHYRMTFNGEDYSGEYLFINVSNIALNGGNCIPNPLSVPDDGMLDIITCKSSSALNSMNMLPAYTSGQFYKFPDYLKHYRLKEMHCESDKLMSVILDGETFYTHELDLKILPKAVKIVSPNGINFADYSQLVKGAIK